MYYLDMHTHRQAAEAEAVAIVCCLVEADGKVDPTTAPYRSYGIHPCRIEGDGEAQWSALLRCVGQPECVAIGEAGLDRLSPIAMSLQTTLFERQAVLAEQWRKPLIVHCVKAWEELLACRKRLRPEQPWVIHGFRAKEPLARQLLRQGLYLSFGRYFHPEAARAAWPDRLLLETDEAAERISLVYERMAAALGEDQKALRDQIGRNSAFLRLKNTTFAANLRKEDASL